jgi:probable rRNA maturation factor
VSLTLNIQEFPADLDLSKAEAAFRALATALTEVDGIINLVLVDDEEIRAMNAEFAGNDYATDVLSFSYIENGGEPIEGVIGEMAISLETAERQAKEARHSLADELALLVVHGTLHILGHDHQTAAEQAAMSELQREYLTAAGADYKEPVWKD